MEKNCEKCGVLFQYTPNPNFPDKRKYCDTCSAQRKAEWEAKQGQQQIPQAAPTKAVLPLDVCKHDVVINRVEKPHSYEFGKAGARHKIYYGEVLELREHIQMLRNAGLIEEEPPEFE